MTSGGGIPVGLAAHIDLPMKPYITKADKDDIEPARSFPINGSFWRVIRCPRRSERAHHDGYEDPIDRQAVRLDSVDPLDPPGRWPQTAP